uniref:Uncharacterized protein n=1 Tax=Arundo donax TaxID=35708 RepID=A0A0A9AU46_ARUDO
MVLNLSRVSLLLDQVCPKFHRRLIFIPCLSN